MRDTPLSAAGAGSAATDEITMLRAAEMRTEVFILKGCVFDIVWEKARVVDVLES